MAAGAISPRGDRGGRLARGAVLKLSPACALGSLRPSLQNKSNFRSTVTTCDADGIHMLSNTGGVGSDIAENTFAFRLLSPRKNAYNLLAREAEKGVALLKF